MHLRDTEQQNSGREKIPKRSEVDSCCACLARDVQGLGGCVRLGLPAQCGSDEAHSLRSHCWSVTEAFSAWVSLATVFGSGLGP